MTTPEHSTQDGTGAEPVASTAELAGKLRFSRRLNVVLVAIVVFLGVVLAAQLMQADQTPLAGAAPQTPTTGVSASREPAPPSPTGRESATATPEAAAGSYNELAFVRRDQADPMAIGALDAPVVLSEWTDTRCPFCAVFSRETLPTVVQEYVDQGLVRVEFHDAVMFGEESLAAAVAARAAGEQGKYAEFMQAMFDVAPEREHPDMPRDKLIGFATTAGVPDIALFTKDLDRPDLAAAVQASTATMQELGITSVPFFVVGDQAISGAQPLPVFRAVLDKQIALATN